MQSDELFHSLRQDFGTIQARKMCEYLNLKALIESDKTISKNMKFIFESLLDKCYTEILYDLKRFFEISNIPMYNE